MWGSFGMHGCIHMSRPYIYHVPSMMDSHLSNQLCFQECNLLGQTIHVRTVYVLCITELRLQRIQLHPVVLLCGEQMVVGSIQLVTVCLLRIDQSFLKPLDSPFTCSSCRLSLFHLQQGKRGVMAGMAASLPNTSDVWQSWTSQFSRQHKPALCSKFWARRDCVMCMSRVVFLHAWKHEAGHVHWHDALVIALRTCAWSKLQHLDNPWVHEPKHHRHTDRAEEQSPCLDASHFETFFFVT